MKVIETAIPGLMILEPDVRRDTRGFFLESFRAELAESLGMDRPFVQDNHSRSRRGTVRGLHYQHPGAQAKLCRVVRGDVLDVLVDVRRGSPAFGKAVTVRLSEDNFRQVYVPRGLAHGFAVLSDEADFLYKCDAYYAPEQECGILWDDPSLGIDWLVGEPILSERDRALPRLADMPPDRLPVYREA